MVKQANNPVSSLTEYELRYLTTHLFEAGRWGDLHHLLSLEAAEGKNAWYEASREVIGDKQIYRDDLALGWRAAEETNDLPAQCRYALMTASLNSIARNVPPVLLLRAVEHGSWTVEQVQTQIRFTPNPRDQAELIFGLTPYMSGDERDRQLGEAAAVARRIPLPRARDMIGQMGFFLADPTLREAAAAVWPHIGRDTFCRTLAALGFEAQAIGVVDALEPDPGNLARMWYEDDLVFRLPKSFQERSPLIHMAYDNRELWREGFPEEVLEALAPYRQAYHLMARALSALGPVLSLDGLKRAVNVSLKILTEQARAQAFIGLAPFVPPAMLKQMLKNIRRMRSVNAKADALIGLAPHLSERLQKQALRILRTSRRDFERNRAQARLLTGIAPHLSSKILQAALGEVRRMHYPVARGIALVGLAPSFPESRGRRLLQEGERLCWQSLENVRRHAGWGAERTNAYAEALMDQLPGLDKRTRDDVMLEAVLAPAGHRTVIRPRLKVNLAVDLAELGCPREAIRMIKYNQDLPEYYQAAAIGVATRLAETGRPGEFLAVAKLVEDHPGAFREILVRVAHRFPPDLLAAALELASHTGDRHTIASVLVKLLPHLPETLANIALNTIEGLRGEREYARLLADIALYIPRRELSRIEAACQDIEGRYEADRVQARLISRRAKEQGLEAALRQIRALGSARFRVEALAAVAASAGAGQRESLLQEAEERALELEEGIFVHSIPHQSIFRSEESMRLFCNDRDLIFRAKKAKIWEKPTC